MDIVVTRKIKYHGWTLPAGPLTGATRNADGSFNAPHPRVAGASIHIPSGRAKLG